MPKLIAATSGPCAGLEDPKDPRQVKFSPADPNDGVHRVDVQHFEDTTTRVLCTYFRNGVCNLVYKATKDGGDFKLSGKTAPCPFSVVTIEEPK